VGTLGKIEVQVHTPATVLERLYTARFANLKVGMTRLRTDARDGSGRSRSMNGVSAGWRSTPFYFTTTTGNSATLLPEFGSDCHLGGSCPSVS